MPARVSKTITLTFDGVIELEDLITRLAASRNEMTGNKTVSVKTYSDQRDGTSTTFTISAR